MWQVAKVDELAPGERTIVEVAGRSIGVFNVKGRIIAVLDVCPHELAPVCLGRVGGSMLPSQPGEFRWGREGEILAYPWRGWEFDLLTGEALADCRRLRRYPASIEDDTVFIMM